MGSAIAKNEKKPRPRIKTPPDLRKLSKNDENFRASPSEIIISTLNNNTEPIELVDCSSITNENDAKQLVDEVWRLIDRQTTKQTPGLKEKSLKANVVRIFVSSTFVDCHSERNVLVKEVFPELRDWCAENGLILIDVDLRWGVPAETSTSRTIEICMHELDECHKETQGQPFFLGLIGDRYGWVPSKDNLTEDLRRDYDWVPNVSITHMEILHGAYRCKNPNAFFLLRDSASLNDVPSEFRKDFEENSVLSKLQLEELKKRLRSRFVNGCFDYSPVFDGFDESSGRKLVKFKGNEKFVESIKNFFKKRITAAFSLEKRNESDSADVSMILKQEQFVQDSSAWFVGRVEELKALHAFVESSEPRNCTKLTNQINDESTGIHLFGKVPWSKDNSTPYLFVKGKSGYGKSSLLAKFVAECFKKRHANHIFYQFLGLDDASGNEENLLKRLIRFSGVVEDFDSSENDRGKLIEIWKEKALTKISASKTELIIVLDALNKTSWSQSGSHLKWLPHCFSKNVRCVVSSDADDIPTVCRLEETGPYRLDLNTLPTNDQKFFIDAYLGRFGKKLDANQMNDILVRDRTPVWMWLACEELRVFGDFRNLKRKINSLPDDTTDLSWYIVERLIREDDEKRKNVEKFLKFLACEREGFGENYAPSLLGSIDETKPAPYTDWNVVKIRLKPFLNINNGIVNFKHYSFREAVEKNFLSDPNVSFPLYNILALFYENFCKSDQYLFTRRWPYWLIKSEQKQKAVNFLFKDNYGKMATPQWLKRNYFKDLRCKNSTFSPNGKNNAYLCTFCAPSIFSQSCLVCSLPAQNCKDGLLCMQHNGMGMPNCLLCGKFSPPTTSSKVVLCTFCSFEASQCCKMF